MVNALSLYSLAPFFGGGGGLGPGDPPELAEWKRGQSRRPSRR